VGVPGQAETEGVHPAHVRAIERAERLLVARLGQADQLGHQLRPGGRGGGRDQRGEEPTIGGKRT
jgi:hypothetical protein